MKKIITMIAGNEPVGNLVTSIVGFRAKLTLSLTEYPHICLPTVLTDI